LIVRDAGQIYVPFQNRPRLACLAARSP
jgi:hypothetical protein